MDIQTGSRQQQLLTLLLTSQSGLCIDEMANELDISRNAVKQHLVALEKQQLVKEAALTHTGGRPARRYVLTPDGINSFPKQYAWFCNLLLAELSHRMSEEELETMMWHIGTQLANTLVAQFSNKTEPEKVSALVELMQSLGYHAHWTQEQQHMTIQAHNCVYHDLAQQHPALCQFDLALISTLLNRPIEQTACMAKQDCDCRFKIGHHKSEK